MDHDFFIEIVAASGLEPLMPFIDEMPFALQLTPDDDSGEQTLIQEMVSEFAGFSEVRHRAGDRFLFTASIRRSSVGDPEHVIRMMSVAFARAGFPHWIWRIEHELDEDELVVDLGGDLHPASHRGKGRWAKSTEE